MRLILFSSLASLVLARSVLDFASVGGGNVGTNGVVDNTTLAQLQVLKTMQVGGCRTNLYPGSYIHNQNNWSRPVPEGLDEFMGAALAHNVTPIILFEYYAPQFETSTPWGSFDEWFGVGAAFAKHLMPGGTWATNVSAPAGYGVTVYTAVNEPDGGAGFIPGGNPGPAAYASGLCGLAMGVKSVFPAAKVLPGGFMSPNAHNDLSLAGLAAVLAPLWANGTLDGVDLHTYYDVQYAPMENTFARSAQADYDGILQRVGLSGSNLSFYTTENNYKLRLVSEPAAALGFLTGIWDQLTVASAANVPVSAQQFPWNIFNTLAEDEDYGMAVSLLPTFKPALRGCTWALVAALLRLPGAWTWESVDPRGSGVSRLRSSDSLLVAWQDRAAWTNLPDSHAFTLSALPPGTASLRVYGWDGLRSRLDVPPGADAITLKNLPGNETYMFLAQPQGAPLPIPLAGCTGW